MSPRTRVPSSLAVLAILALALQLAACERRTLSFRVLHVKVDHDRFEVLDAAIGDPDRDGDLDLVVATEHDLRWLRHDRGGWSNETAGTGLAEMRPVQRLHGVAGDDLIAERNGLLRLRSSGIGTWSEEPIPGPDQIPPVPMERDVDLDGDGRAERVRLVRRRLVVETPDGSGGWRDVTRATGADGLTLPGEGRRLLAGDLDGDGSTDLLVVGGRLFALMSNGGVITAPQDAALGASLAPTSGVAPARVARRHGPASASDPAASARALTARAQQDIAPSPATIAAPATTARLGDDEPAPPAPPAPWFADATEAAGLVWTHREGDEQWDIRPTMGPGAAFGDVDGDGDPDLYVPGGSEQQGVLFVNDGAAHFSERAEAAGLHAAAPGPGMGALFADWDDDGDPDLYVTRDGPNLMWRNDGGRFVDVTAAAGTCDARWGAGCAFADTDRDGDLDLYVANYLQFDPSLLPPEEQRREDPLAMLPYVFPGQANVFYANDGDGTFSDATESAGLLDPDGKSLGVLFLDHDDDGWPDLYVANDTTPNTLHHNLGDGSFEEISLLVGVDDPRGGMGLAAADLDADGDEDLLLTNWQLEPNALYRNNRVHGESRRRFMPAFEDVAVQSGLAQASVGYVGWGCVLSDLDGDGDHDALVVNGYTSPDYETTMICVGQRDQLFENVAGPGPFAEHRQVPRFALVEPDRAGPAFARALPGRGLAVADADGDGDLDAVVSANNGPLTYLRNERGGRFLRVVCEGRSPRDAAGARVTLSLDDGRAAHAVVRVGEGYLGGHERGLRFGLGAAKATAVTVRWPDGSSSTHAAPADGVLHVEQP